MTSKTAKTAKTAKTVKYKSTKLPSRGLNRWLTPEERSGYMKLGALLKFAEHGVAPQHIDKYLESRGYNDRMTKTAFLDNLGSTVSGFLGGAAGVAAGSLKLVIGASLLAGIPAGILWHVASSGTRREEVKEKSLKRQQDMYTDAAYRLQRNLEV